MRECKEQGCRVLLLTSKSLETSPWPKEAIDETFYMADKNKEWNMRDVIYGVSFVARKEKVDRIVALDDFDVEKAAALREHLRVPGMGDTTARYFRDKLAMRMRAQEMEIPVPEFIHVLNHNELNEFADKVQFPYMIKPRMLAGSHGLKKVQSKDEMWNRINHLGDEQSFFLMERFTPGIFITLIQLFMNTKYGLQLPASTADHLLKLHTREEYLPAEQLKEEVKKNNSF